MNVDVDEALLILKVAFIVLLYLFIWRIVRSASRDFRTGPGMLPAQESVLMRPTDAASLGLASVKRARLVVIKSPALDCRRGGAGRLDARRNRPRRPERDPARR